MSKLTIALPTGRLGKNVLTIFKEKNITNTVDMDSRKLDIIDNDTGYRYLFVKPSDVLTYVKKGVADIGVVGKDTILEANEAVYELFDLEIGRCKFVVAGFEGTPIKGREEALVVATKYPSIATSYFKKNNQAVEIIKLNGSVELAPLVGLSDVIVDITETGRTLIENGLTVLDEMNEISARVVANRVSYRFKNDTISSVLEVLKR